MSKARSKRFRRGITIQTHHFERAINSLTVMYTWLWIKICINSISCLLCWIHLTKLTKTKTNGHFCIFLFYFSYFCKCTISFQLVWVLFLLTMCLYNLVCGHTHTPSHYLSQLWPHTQWTTPCIQMRPQLSPSNPGTMSSKEREWLEQRAGYSLEMEGGMEGWEPRWEEEGMRGDGNGVRTHL